VTMCTCGRPRLAWSPKPNLTLPRYALRRPAATPQLAGLTDDMLKPSTRTGGIAARLK